MNEDQVGFQEKMTQMISELVRGWGVGILGREGPERSRI